MKLPKKHETTSTGVRIKLVRNISIYENFGTSEVICSQLLPSGYFITAQFKSFI